MVYLYHPLAVVAPEERGEPRVYGFEGDKLLVAAAGPYLAIVTADVAHRESPTLLFLRPPPTVPSRLQGVQHEHGDPV